MNGLELAALVAVAVWLFALTLVALVVVRQVAVLSVRFQRAGPRFELGSDGIEVGKLVPEAVVAAVPEIREQRATILLLSATCGPCRQLVPHLRELYLSEPVIALLPGRRELAESLREMIPPSIRVIEDPLAYELSQALRIESTPFAMQIEAGRVKAKAFLRTPTDLTTLIGAWVQANPPDSRKEVLSSVR